MKARDEFFLLTMTLLLLANDHLFKQWYPGLITGKLSDLAGPFVVYRLLRGIPPLGLNHGWSTLISLGFAIAVKTSQPLADLAARSTCGLIFSHCGFIADPWDLLAFIPFVVWAGIRARAGIRMLSLSAESPETSPDR
jgi:hypothetical protein